MHTHLKVAGHFDTKANKWLVWQLTSALVMATAMVGATACKLASRPSSARQKFHRMIPAVLVIFEDSKMCAETKSVIRLSGVSTCIAAAVFHAHVTTT
jgi:hypothetical protein